MTAKENRERWTAALRSGEYQQGMGALHRGDAFCCLGVACDIYNHEVGGLSESSDQDGTVRYNNYCFGLPYPVMEWLGLATSDGYYGDNRSLSIHNDDGMSFDAIADIINAAPKGLLSSEAEETKWQT